MRLPGALFLSELISLPPHRQKVTPPLAQRLLIFCQISLHPFQRTLSSEVITKDNIPNGGNVIGCLANYKTQSAANQLSGLLYERAEPLSESGRLIRVGQIPALWM